MIARIIIPIILAVVLCDWYVDNRFLCKLARRKTLFRLLWWLQTAFVLVFSLSMAAAKDFAPSSMAVFNSYLLMLLVWVLPKFVFVVCSALGWGHCAYHKTLRNWGNPIGALAAFCLAVLAVYGYTWGFDTVVVRHVVYRSKDLPKAFDGYRIVQFSDAHVGTYGSERADVLCAAVDSINAQHGDMVTFVGDLQNMTPDELLPHTKTLGRIKAKDGVFSVLGNHDYAVYIDADNATKERNCRRVVDAQREMGWTLLRNENRIIRRGGDSIVVAGMEYEGNSVKVESRGDIRKTLCGIRGGLMAERSVKPFVIMLQHDPTSWSTDILPNSTAQLTLSGHTHAMQMKMFGWSPAALVYKQWGGTYYKGDRAISVSTGLGGFVPFRLFCPGEIVVIELRAE